MQLVSDDSYEEMAAAFQCCQIQLLDQELRKHGLPEEMRRQICGGFTRDFGVFLDQYSFDSEVGVVFPYLGFSRKHSQEHPDEIIVNNGYFSFSEYAGGDLYWYFDENRGVEVPQKMSPLGNHP